MVTSGFYADILIIFAGCAVLSDWPGNFPGLDGMLMG